LILFSHVTLKLKVTLEQMLDHTLDTYIWQEAILRALPGHDDQRMAHSCTMAGHSVLWTFPDDVIACKSRGVLALSEPHKMRMGGEMTSKRSGRGKIKQTQVFLHTPIGLPVSRLISQQAVLHGLGYRMHT
jgi:hypothetical protein